MYEKSGFSQKWSMLLSEYIKKGGKIKIAHTISRASGEMLVALQKWIPIYMTGAVEPYFYPKILDRVFRKTLLLPRGILRLTASSVGEQTEDGINCYVRDTNAVRSIENEFWGFLKLCKPLMQIFNVTRSEQFLEVLKNFNKNTENMIAVYSAPSFFTMPLKTAESLASRTGEKWILKHRCSAEQAFLDMMKSGKTLTEILNLPDAAKVKKGDVRLSACDIFNKSEVFYTPSEFADHLDKVIEKLELYDSYNVVISPAIPPNELVYVKEDTGVILVKGIFLILRLH